MARLFIYLLLPLLFACNSVKQEGLATASHNKVAQLLEQFKEPSSAYAPMPLFVWNGKVTKADLDIQLADLKSKGFGGVFVHPRPSLITEYLSDEWFDLFGYTVKRCKELGLEVWIYDENSYPSGFAGGHVPDRYPSSYNEGLGLKGTLTHQLPEDLSPYTVVLKQSGERWEEIVSPLGRGQGRATNEAGTYYLFEKTYYEEKPWNAGFSYVDLLKPGVTDAFLNVTMTEGYERFSNEFGKAIKGVFSDEPAIYSPDWQSFRWTAGLFEAFQQRWGYDLKPHLPSLIAETGDWKKIRHNYYSILLQLFVGNWAKPMSAYCDKRGMKWTGHYWEHEWPDPDDCPDNMAMYAYFQQPGIDLLFNDYDENKYYPATPGKWPQPQFGCVRNVKELSSVANQLGKERSLCEMYGAGGWEFSFRDLKRLGDWSYALGVNFLCQHLSFMSIQGARKYDHPASFSYHTPWWKQYKSLNDYFRRLSFALTSGEQINKVLIVEPTTSTWMYNQRGSVSNHMVDMGKSFQDFLTGLEKQQIEYDLVSEHILSEYGSVTGRKLHVGDRTYDLVLIPEMAENLNASTIRLLNNSNYTKILNLAATTRIDGKEITTEMFPVMEPEEPLSMYLQTDEWQIIEHNPNKGDLFHHRRVLDDGQLLFLTNVDTEESVTGSFRLRGSYVLSLDLHTGDIYNYPSQQADGKVTIAVDIPPSGSLLLLISDTSVGGYGVLSQGKGYQVVASSSQMTVSPVEKNVLTLDFCDLILEGKEYPQVHTVKASDILFRHYGFQGNPWNSAVQFKDNVLKHAFPENSGYKVVYHFSIDGSPDMSSMKLIVEDTKGEVKINGQPVQPLFGEWWLDRGFKVYPAGNTIRKGTNEISIEISPMHVLAEIEPVYLLGDFSLKSIDKGWEITSPKPLRKGSWKEQGMPFYSKAVDYTNTYTFESKTSCRVRLTEWKGSVSEVLVNGQPAGLIYLPPYMLDISDKVKAGENHITVRVIGSNKNLLGPFHGNLVEGLVGPGQWMGIDNMPEGKAYHQIHYGLFEEFEVEIK